MFRELIRKKAEISREDCIDILKKETRGVLSVNGDDGYPYGMPLNHFYNEDDGKIYFHSGMKKGHRLEALEKSDKVSFCVCEQGYKNEGEWAYNVRSVIVFGRMEAIDDFDRVCDISARLSRKFTNDEEYIQKEIRLCGHKTLLLCLTPEHICGKRIKEE